MVDRLGVGTQKKYKLLATGQTTQYGGYLDDGYYEKGKAKAYTVLNTGQYAGSITITLNGKTNAHTNACVYDNNTGLMWSQKASGSVGTGSDGALPWTTNGNGEGIFAYCGSANAGTLGGYTDWRVPNIYELLSIMDYEATTGYPNSIAFPTIFSSAWTSTTVPGATANAFYVTPGGGQIASGVKTTAVKLIFVRG